MSSGRRTRWGILGAANIARGQFMPGLRESGDGVAAVVASRDLSRAQAFAHAEGVERAGDDYRAVLADDEIDAVYIPLPNSLHAQWTLEALYAGKHILCEKPLCATLAETETVIATARTHPEAPLWEAFVFPFQAQHARIVELIGDGAIGNLREIESAFHFNLAATEDIRLSAELGGGSLADVGCYPIRLGHELLGPVGGPMSVYGRVEGEVDVDASAIVAHGDQRLVLTCGFGRPFDVFTRLLGDEGRVHLTNPFHPSPGDRLEIHRPGADPVVEHPTTDERSFTAALRHVHAVVRGEEEPRHLAVDSALSTAATLAALQDLVAA
ncbi:MAG TPA: Gfo/Idh/MocA family oxidoreductase [Solirubrobacteraceae bacterium]|nr:Gfo/Idh/MocA family oxidoreductase [Solirubrobacteraceae bacterium]